MNEGDLVHMKIDGAVLESTLGVVTGSVGDNSSRVLWLDTASDGSDGLYENSSLQLMNDPEYQDTLYLDW